MNPVVRVTIMLALACSCVRSASAQVVVSEIYTHFLSFGHERAYVELLNGGSAPVDLTGWSFRYLGAVRCRHGRSLAWHDAGRRPIPHRLRGAPLAEPAPDAGP